MTQRNYPIYKIVDGQRVRISQREPTRRYKTECNLQNGDTYDIEFTDEEEKQRDAEEAQGRLEEPQRAEEKRKQEEKAEKFRESLIYEQRIIAFVDILGWKDAIEQSIKDKEYVKKLGIALEAINGQVNLTKWMMERADATGWPGDPQITQFSDSVVLSVKYDSFAQLHLTDWLGLLVRYLFGQGFVVRGGISGGLLYHRGAMIYGPALIKAYGLEQNARFPRILLEGSIADNWGIGIPVRKDDKIIAYKKLWRIDKKDGLYFFDFLQPFPNMLSAELNKKTLSFQLEPIRKLIMERLDTFKNCNKTFKKYKWIAYYFNEILEEYEGIEIKRIPLRRRRWWNRFFRI